jgi:hypothetical protein
MGAAARGGEVAAYRFRHTRSFGGRDSMVGFLYGQGSLLSQVKVYFWLTLSLLMVTSWEGGSNVS